MADQKASDENGNRTVVANYVATLSADLATMARGAVSTRWATCSKWSASRPKAKPGTAKTAGV